MNYLSKFALFALIGLCSAAAIAQKPSQQGKDKTENTVTEDFGSPEFKGIQEAQRLARLYGIEDSGRINKLKQASIKYFEGMEQLQVSHGQTTSSAANSRSANSGSNGNSNPGKGNAYGNHSAAYQNSLKELKANYHAALREVLPQS